MYCLPAVTSFLYQCVSPHFSSRKSVLKMKKINFIWIHNHKFAKFQNDPHNPTPSNYGLGVNLKNRYFYYCNLG